MKLSQWLAMAGMAAWLVAAPAATLGAQTQKAQPNLHIGYVYPAGGRQGATFEAVVAGQFLFGVTNIFVSGGGVTATIADYIRPISGKELNDLRIQMDDLLAKRAVVRNDFKALENFRSFKNAKDIKKDKTEEDKELQDLKKKYAGAKWTTEDDQMLMEVRKRLAGGVKRPANPAISEIVVLKMTVAPNAEVGQRELRLGTMLGLSNPLAFYVGQLPEFSKEASKAITEQKSQIAKTAFAPKNRVAAPTMKVTLPAVVNGQILPGAADRFQFTATKGQRVVVAASARELIPYIPDAVPGWFQATLALYGPRGKELAYDDDFGFNPDPVLYYQIPADGEYTVEIKDAIYRGREDFVYRITIGELPFVTSIFPLGGRAGAETTVEVKGWNLPDTHLTLDNKNKTPGVYPICAHQGTLDSNFVSFKVDTLPECFEQKPNNDQAHAQRVTLPIIINGRMEKPNDTDVFRFEGKAGDEVVAEVHARRLNSPLDSVLKLNDAAGNQLAFNDDHVDKGAGLTTHHADSYLRATLPKDGDYYIHITDAQHKGGPEYAYRLRISAPQPDFELRTVPSSLVSRAGASVPVTVYALRRDGFSGAIALSLKGAPDGFKLVGGTVPADKDQVKLTLSVPMMPRPEPLDLNIEGRATVEGREVVHAAVPAEDMMQAFEYRHLVPSKELMVAVMGRPLSGAKGAVKVLSETPIRIPAGGTACIRLATPTSAFASRVRLELSDAPDGVSIQNLRPSSDGAEIVVQSDGDKMKVGQTGNLIVKVFAKPQSPNPKSKNKPQYPLGTLPAIPFEIVQK